PITDSRMAFHSLFPVLPIRGMRYVPEQVCGQPNPISSSGKRGVGYPAPVPRAGPLILGTIVLPLTAPSPSNQAIFRSGGTDRPGVDNVYLICHTGHDCPLAARQKLSAHYSDCSRWIFRTNGIHGIPFIEPGGHLPGRQRSTARSHRSDNHASYTIRPP